VKAISDLAENLQKQRMLVKPQALTQSFSAKKAGVNTMTRNLKVGVRAVMIPKTVFTMSSNRSN
jgi:hypothetical protein